MGLGTTLYASDKSIHTETRLLRQTISCENSTLCNAVKWYGFFLRFDGQDKIITYCYVKLGLRLGVTESQAFISVVLPFETHSEINLWAPPPPKSL